MIINKHIVDSNNNHLIWNYMNHIVKYIIIIRKSYANIHMNDNDIRIK